MEATENKIPGRSGSAKLEVNIPCLMNVSNLQQNFGGHKKSVDGASTPGMTAETKWPPAQEKGRETQRRFHEEYEDTHVVLGRGALGSVHVYRQLKSGEDFAVKVIEKLDEAHHQRVLKEVDMCHQFQDCKSIINLVDFFEETDNFYVVFEKMEGGDFYTLLESRDYLSEPEASRAIAELASALQALHSKGIAHRDIKPENVLCAAKGEATPLRLCDFDLASYSPSHHPCSEDTSSPMCFSSIVGSPDYIPPEVLSVVDTDPSTFYGVNCDLWSLGVLLYNMLCGGLPFFGDCQRPDCTWKGNITSCKACDQHLYTTIRRGHYSFPPFKHRPVSSKARDLIQRLLVREPSARLPASEILKHPFVTAHQVSPPHAPAETDQQS